MSKKTFDLNDLDPGEFTKVLEVHHEGAGAVPLQLTLRYEVEGEDPHVIQIDGSEAVAFSAVRSRPARDGEPADPYTGPAGVYGDLAGGVSAVANLLLAAEAADILQEAVATFIAARPDAANPLAQAILRGAVFRMEHNRRAAAEGGEDE